MKEPKVTKKTLEKMLTAKGFSVRRAKKAVKAFFEQMRQALQRGECVEAPGGLIYVAPGKPRRDFRKQYDLQTKQMRHKFVHYQKPGKRVIRFRPTLELDLLTEKEKRARQAPVPDTPERKESRQLASELLGRKASDRDLASLQDVIQQRGPKPDSLLNRLRAVKTRTTRPMDISDLCWRMAELYWI